MKYRIIIEGAKYNEDYFFTAPEEGEIKEEVNAIIEEMKAGNISKFTIEIA